MLRSRLGRALLLAGAMMTTGAVPAFAWAPMYWSYADGTHRGPVHFDHPALTWNFVPLPAENSYQCPPWEQTNVKQGATNWTTGGTAVSMTQSTSSNTQYFDIEVECYTNPSDGAGNQPGTNSPAGGDGGCLNANWMNDASGGHWVCTSARVCIYIGNGGSQQSDPQYDVYTSMHEFGHTFGLAHSCTYNSIMSGPNADAGCPNQSYNTSNPTSPTQDDKDGVNWTYGPHSSGGCAPTTLQIANILGNPPSGC